MKLPNQFAAMLLDGLRSREREALGLHFLDQFGVTDVAELLGIKPDSASGHLSKGLAAVAKIVSGSVDEARELLNSIGEVHARRVPKRRIRVIRDRYEAALDVMPHRQIMAGVVREGSAASDITSFFVTELNGRSASVAQARAWCLDSLVTLGLDLRKHLLAAKGIKSLPAFEHEANTYFFPAGYGCAELYYEKNFRHEPLTLPLREGHTILAHFPPMPPLDREHRSAHVPDTWPLRVMDLGEYKRHYDDGIIEDAEEGLRRRGTRTNSGVAVLGAQSAGRRHG